MPLPSAAAEPCPANQCRYSFVDAAFLEIVGPDAQRYRVEFVDTRSGAVLHTGEIENNQWLRTPRQYFTPWEIRVYRLGEVDCLVFTHTFNCRRKKVHIAFESRALGDTLAWISAVDEFRKAHGCEMYCSTFMNEQFRTQYPRIKFVEPGTQVKHLYARYRVGWFYDAGGKIDFDRNPEDFRTRPLTATPFDILGLSAIEIRPRLKTRKRPAPVAGAYVCVGIHATAQAKYWNNPDGWNELVAYLRERQYRVVLLSREGRDYMGNTVPEDVQLVPSGSLDDIVEYLRHARLFVGVGSGLSWLAWATGIPTCIISGFSLPYTEPRECIRVAPNDAVCTGCFNRYRLERGNWNWCPEWDNSPRMFECSRAISSAAVIAAIEHLL
jgi:autotransporter strand-loop-strand O-heptosyltransferase